jgi:hypothetical protein
MFTGVHTDKNEQHWVYVGATPEGKEYFGNAPDANHQFTVSGLPSSGKIYVRYVTRPTPTDEWVSVISEYMMNVADVTPPTDPLCLPGKTTMAWNHNPESDNFTGYHVHRDKVWANLRVRQDATSVVVEVPKGTNATLLPDTVEWVDGTTYFFALTAYRLQESHIDGLRRSLPSNIVQCLYVKDVPVDEEITTPTDLIIQ